MWRGLLFVCITLIILYTGFLLYVPTKVAERSFGLIIQGVHSKADPKGAMPSTPSRARFVGDVMLARHVEQLLLEHGDTYVFDRLPTLPLGTFIIGNFEAAIPRIHTQTKDFAMSFSVDQMFIPTLYDEGFRYMSLANNHSYDFGSDALHNTQAVLKHNKITPFGDPQRIASTSITYFQLGSTTIGMLGLQAVYTNYDQATIRSAVARMSEHSDVQLAVVHWGEEYARTHSQTQEHLAHELIDAGVDAIIGHHPHVVEDIGYYRGAPIFYSLGNYIFDQYFNTDVQQGLMLDLSAQDKTMSFTLLPISSEKYHSMPARMETSTASYFLHALAQRSDSRIRAMIANSTITTTYE